MVLPRNQIILGLDPGYARLGWGVVEKNGRDVHAVAYGCIETKAGQPAPLRLQKIAEELQAVMRKFKPSAVGVEELFFAQNTKTALQVSQARGVLLLVAQQAGVAIHEFTPLQVKQALTGYGKADKGQMQRMVKLLLGLKIIPKPDDAADALAVAVACARVARTGN